LYNASRETIYQALFQLARGSFGYKYARRRLPKSLAGVDQARRPALFQVEPSEHYVQDFGGRPPQVTLQPTLLILTWAQGLDSDDGPEPITILNPMLDALEAALRPNATSGVQTLGLDSVGNPLVSHCWIEGEVVKRAGDLDGNGFAVVPIRILVPA
jgi:hypothetical protein